MHAFAWLKHTTQNSGHLAFLSSVYLQSRLSLHGLSINAFKPGVAEGVAATASGIADSADLANLLGAQDPSAVAIY